MSDLVTLAVYDAYGGPEIARMADDGHEAGPTDAGEYRVARIGQHTSDRYPLWSTIPWGAPLRVEGDDVHVQYKGQWQRLSTVVPLTKKDIESQYALLYGTRLVPKRWVFNDFGHVTCYLYRDANGNGRRDRNEPIHGEFMHTTPVDEAMSALRKPVELVESHGCIHVKPTDIDEMIRRGFLRPGTRVVIHEYSDRKVPFPKRGFGRPPFEMHFFPSMRKVVVLGKGHA